MTKRTISLLLAVCLLFSLGVSAAAAEDFSDVKAGSWYYDNVKRMVSMGAINGYGDGTFRPAGNITNGEFLTILMRTLSDTKEYPAAEGQHWASGALRAAYDARICTQVDLTEADLNTPITRAGPPNTPPTLSASCAGRLRRTPPISPPSSTISPPWRRAAAPRRSSGCTPPASSPATRTAASTPKTRSPAARRPP
jgi:hypothetical protein